MVLYRQADRPLWNFLLERFKILFSSITASKYPSFSLVATGCSI